MSVGTHVLSFSLLFFSPPASPSHPEPSPSEVRAAESHGYELLRPVGAGAPAMAAEQRAGAPGDAASLAPTAPTPGSDELEVGVRVPRRGSAFMVAGGMLTLTGVIMAAATGPAVASHLRGDNCVSSTPGSDACWDVWTPGHSAVFGLGVSAAFGGSASLAYGVLRRVRFDRWRRAHDRPRIPHDGAALTTLGILGTAGVATGIYFADNPEPQYRCSWVGPCVWGPIALLSTGAMATVGIVKLVRYEKWHRAAAEGRIQLDPPSLSAGRSGGTLTLSGRF